MSSYSTEFAIPKYAFLALRDILFSVKMHLFKAFLYTTQKAMSMEIFWNDYFQMFSIVHGNLWVLIVQVKQDNIQEESCFVSEALWFILYSTIYWFTKCIVLEINRGFPGGSDELNRCLIQWWLIWFRILEKWVTFVNIAVLTLQIYCHFKCWFILKKYLEVPFCNSFLPHWMSRERKTSLKYLLLILKTKTPNRYNKNVWLVCL